MEKQNAKIGVPMRREFFPKIRSVDEKTRTITFVASDETIDRYGDIIRVAGWQCQNYLKNPVVLWSHRSQDPPVGKCVDLKIETKPPALVQTVEFADAKTYPFGETVFQLYKGGFLRACSVGFVPLEMQPIPDGGTEFLSQELLELSCVPIPANANALARCVQKGFSQSDLKRVFTASSSEDVYKEIASASLDYAEIAVGLAEKVVRETLAKLKAAGVQSNEVDELTLDELLATVKVTPIPKSEETTIATLDDLAEAPSTEIATLSDLGAILAQQAPNDNSDDTYFGSDLIRSRPIKGQ